MEVSINYENYVIYKITNVLNGKVYIGQTCRGLNVRWCEHKRNAMAGNEKTLYKAMRLYGIENFNIIAVKEGMMTKDDADRLESEFIIKYNSFHNGYNMTHGGEGKPTINSVYKDAIVGLYKNQGKTINEIHEELGFDQKTISQILKKAGIKIQHSAEYRKIKIQMLNKETYEVIKEFDSVVEAGIYLGVKEPDKTHIYKVIKGQRKSTLGYSWRYA